MAQVKIFGMASRLKKLRAELSDAIHDCVVEALHFPPDKRTHRFFPMEKDDLFYPAGRTEAYTILEITMIQGRTMNTKKHLVKLLYERIKQKTGIDYQDLEICILESPAGNWGFRGQHGDEIKLDYKIEV